MMRTRKYLPIVLVFSFVLSGIFHPLSSCQSSSSNSDKAVLPTVITVPSPLVEADGSRLAPVVIREALSFCRQQQLDTIIAFLVDMSIHSGKNRFFIYDLQGDSIMRSGLVCHGMGKGSTVSEPVFSNEKGSNCTSLGKYKTGIRSYSNWGINVHYKMHGLEPSNSNAFARIVVLHSHSPIPDQEIFPDHLPMGWSLGCPVVSDNFMEEIDSILKEKERDVLLWIYN